MKLLSELYSGDLSDLLLAELETENDMAQFLCGQELL
jgi:hypothetical protein